MNKADRQVIDTLSIGVATVIKEVREIKDNHLFHLNAAIVTHDFILKYVMLPMLIAIASGVGLAAFKVMTNGG